MKIFVYGDKMRYKILLTSRNCVFKSCKSSHGLLSYFQVENNKELFHIVGSFKLLLYFKTKKFRCL